MAIVKLQCECKRCKKPMVIPMEQSAISDAGEAQVEIFAKWLTCDACMMELGRIKPRVIQPELPKQAEPLPSQPPSDYD